MVKLSLKLESGIRTAVFNQQRTKIMRILHGKGLPIHLYGGFRQLMGFIHYKNPKIPEKGR